MNNPIKVRITRRCMIGASKVAEPGEVVTLDPADAAGLLSSGRGVAVDEARAREAVDAWNVAAHRSLVAALPRAPTQLWVPMANVSGYSAAGRFH
jgi:hypothetical protein